MRYMSVLPAYNSRFHCRLCSKNASRSVVEFREILLRKDSVIEKAEYRQSIAGAVQTVILTTYIFVECLYALIYFQIFLMAGSAAFSSLQESFEFRQKGTAFTLQGPAYECSGNFLLAFIQFYHTAYGDYVFQDSKIIIFGLLKIYKTEYRPAGKIAKTGGDIRNANSRG